MNRLGLICLLTLLGAVTAPAQTLQPKQFVRYTTADGLSDNTIRAVTQDATGYLWIATAWGLNRFNGDRFLPFHTGSDSSSLPAENSMGLFWIDDHRLVVSGTGLHIIDTRTASHKNIFIPYADRKHQFKFNMTMQVRGDRQGNMYVAARSGFYHFDSAYRLVMRFDYYDHPDVPLYHFKFADKIMELDDKRLMLPTENGLYIYYKDKRLLQKMKAEDEPLMAELLDYPHRNFQMLQARPGRFLVFRTTSDTMLYIDLARKRKQLSRAPAHFNEAVIGWRSKLLPLNDSCWYMNGQMAGLYRLVLHTSTGAMQLYHEPDMDGFQCTDMMFDKERRLLIGTTRGLLRQQNSEPVVQVAVLPAELQNRFANARFDDVYALGDKLFAATREAGLLVFNRSSLQYERQIFFNGLGAGANYIHGMTAVNDHTLLLGTENYPLLLDIDNDAVRPLELSGWNAPYDWAGDVYRDRSRHIWIAAHHIYRFNETAEIFSKMPALPQLLDVPLWMAEDAHGNMWMGRHGLARYNMATGGYDRYIDSFPFNKMSDKQINALTIDRHNEIWFGTTNNGLVAYNDETKTFRHVTSAHGLPDDEAYALLALGNKVWVACYSGIACVDINSLQVSRFGVEDGFPAMPASKDARFFYDSVQRQLCIAFTGALARFDPERILQHKPPPATFIESVVMNGTDLHYLPGNQLAASWQDKALQVSIGSINFADGKTQRYAYRLGAASWTDLGNQPTFSVSGLPPGTHRLQVKVYSASNRWPEQVKEMVIRVQPPFWRRTWFLVAAVLLLLYLIYWLVRWRSSVARKQEMVKTQMEKLRAEDYKAQMELQQITRELSGINEQLAEAQLSALQTQMNPHFVFNALNSIKRMILDSDNETASRYLSKFALMIRMTLEHSKETFVTLQDNIQYLKAYLDMEKLRFDGGFTYHLQIDEQVDLAETLLPSMMIQPLVENAIWHGLMYSATDKKLVVAFRQQQQRIVCTIEDNGIGIRQSEKLRQEHRPMHRSVGLENLQKRIRIMNEKYNTACSLVITDLQEAGYGASGTRAVLQFNLINI